MLGRLVPCGGGDPIPLLKPKVLIGRRSNCDVVLEFSNISSQHCVLELVNGYWQIKDLGSANGTKVNGQRVDSKFLLPGEELGIAKCRFNIEYEPQADGPPPKEEENPFELSLMEKAGLQRRKGEEPRRRMPPRSDKAPPPSPQKFSGEENDAMKWLTGDD
jgi:hypothetical protein